MNGINLPSQSSELKQFFHDGNIDEDDYYSNGPNFNQILSSFPIIQFSQQNVIKRIEEDYFQALSSSQEYKEFLPIYDQNKTWSSQQYLMNREGGAYIKPLVSQSTQEEALSFDGKHEPIIDFELVGKDLNQFKGEVLKVQSLRTGIIKGTLCVDSKSLRELLTPIPLRHIEELISMLKLLLQTKIDTLTNLFHIFSKHLRQDPRTLESYIEFCEISDRSISITNDIVEELDYIEQMNALFSTFQIPFTKNPLGNSLCF